MRVGARGQRSGQRGGFGRVLAFVVGIERVVELALSVLSGVAGVGERRVRGGHGEDGGRRREPRGADRRRDGDSAIRRQQQVLHLGARPPASVLATRISRPLSRRRCPLALAITLPTMSARRTVIQSAHSRTNIADLHRVASHCRWPRRGSRPTREYSFPSIQDSLQDGRE